MKLEILKALNTERAARRAAVVVTDVGSGAQRLVKAADVARDPLQGRARKAHLRSGKSGMEETPTGKVFLTVHVPPPQLVITGAVHISQALAPMATLLGYDVTIVDPRTAFAIAERFPDVKVIAEWPDVALPPLGVDRYTAFVALTHDPKIDDPALTHALARDCFYIGALGSKKTHGRRVERLKAQGVSDAALARIHAPIGLDIGAVSPPEIAVAIMGEITARLRQSGARETPMKFGAGRRWARPRAPIAVHSIRKGGLVLKKGTLIGKAEIAALRGRRHHRDRGGAARAGRRVGGRGGGRDRRGGRGRGRARRSRLHRARQSVRRDRRRAGGRQATRSIASTRSTRRSPSRRSRPIRRWSRAR